MILIWVEGNSIIGKDELINKLRNVDAEIETLKGKIINLQEKRREIEVEIQNFDINAETTRILGSIKTVSSTNTIYKTLGKGTKTTPIMDEFYSSNCDFLVFKRIYSLIASQWHYISIVVIKSEAGVNYHNSGLTMTDLKKSSGSLLFSDSLGSLPKGRLYPLYRELLDIGVHYSFKVSDKISFQTPCLLGGQTFEDQTGYGSEYHGEDLIHQGKEYGDTTKFLIIGAIIET